jgi:ribbon-helix-helix CopG family protein
MLKTDTQIGGLCTAFRSERPIFAFGGISTHRAEVLLLFGVYSMTSIDTKREQAESVPVSLTLPPDLVARLDERAGAELISRSAWIRRTLNSVLRPEGAV